MPYNSLKLYNLGSCGESGCFNGVHTQLLVTQNTMNLCTYKYPLHCKYLTYYQLSIQLSLESIQAWCGSHVKSIVQTELLAVKRLLMRSQKKQQNLCIIFTIIISQFINKIFFLFQVSRKENFSCLSNR